MDDSSADLDQFYSIEEAKALMSALRPEEHRRLAGLAHLRSKELAGVEAHDLLNDAFLKVFTETRKWRRGISVDRYFDQAMRSIVSNKRKHIALEEKYGVIPEQEASKGCNTDIEVKTHNSSASDPARLAHAEKRLAQVMQELASDQNAFAVAMGLSEQKTEREIRDTFGLSEREFASARKRLTRVIMKKFPEGSDT